MLLENGGEGWRKISSTEKGALRESGDDGKRKNESNFRNTVFIDKTESAVSGIQEK